MPSGVEIPELAQGAEHDHAIVSIHILKAAPVEDLDEAVEGEAEDDAAPTDGEGDDEQAAE